MNIFKEARQILDGFKTAEDHEKRRALNKCEWYDPRDKSAYLSSLRLAEKEKQIPKDKVCPACGSVIVSPRSWVISKDKKRACCRSCYFSGVLKGGDKEISPRKIFTNVEIRVKIDGYQLKALRDAKGLKLAAFARVAGWTTTYQYKLETQVKTVKLETAETIIETLERFGVATLDSV